MPPARPGRRVSTQWAAPTADLGLPTRPQHSTPRTDRGLFLGLTTADYGTWLSFYRAKMRSHSTRAPSKDSWRRKHQRSPNKHTRGKKSSLLHRRRAQKRAAVR